MRQDTMMASDLLSLRLPSGKDLIVETGNNKAIVKFGDKVYYEEVLGAEGWEQTVPKPDSHEKTDFEKDNSAKQTANQKGGLAGKSDHVSGSNTKST